MTMCKCTAGEWDSSGSLTYGEHAQAVVDHEEGAHAAVHPRHLHIGHGRAHDALPGAAVALEHASACRQLSAVSVWQPLSLDAASGGCLAPQDGAACALDAWGEWPRTGMQKRWGCSAMRRGLANLPVRVHLPETMSNLFMHCERGQMTPCSPCGCQSENPYPLISICSAPYRPGTTKAELGQLRHHVMWELCTLPVLGYLWRYFPLLHMRHCGRMHTARMRPQGFQRASLIVPSKASCRAMSCKPCHQPYCAGLRTIKSLVTMRILCSSSVSRSLKLKASCAGGGKEAMVWAWGKL